MKRIRAALLVMVMSGLYACGGDATPRIPEATPTLDRWSAPRASRTPEPLLEGLQPLATPGPSPTPLVHEIRAGETLLEIALEYGVELNDLLVANPGVNPRFLSIGQQLLIPGPEGAPAAALLPSPTPLPVMLSAVGCYRTFEGSLRCMTGASHEFDGAVEGLVASITLVGPTGEALRTELAYAPINLLVAGEVMPLVASFAAPIGEYVGATAEVLSVVSASSVPERYASLEWTVDAISRSASGRRWKVAGQLEAMEPHKQDRLQVALLLVALGSEDAVVGYRTEVIEVLGEAEYSLEVSSLAPEILAVRVYAEALLAR